MKKFYAFMLAAVAALMVSVSAKAQEPVSINELRGTWIFRGVASDWNQCGQVLPTIHTFNITVDEETNAVNLTTTMGTVLAYGAAEDGSEDYEDVLRGKYDPATQVLTVYDSYDETKGIYSYLVDEYYSMYTYDMAFQVGRDEQGKVTFQMIPTEKGSMLVIEVDDYDYETAEWKSYYYGYDLGATMKAPANGTLAAGEYELAYTDGGGLTGIMPCTLTDEDGQLTLNVMGVKTPLTAKSVGFGANKVNYGYTAAMQYVVTGEGEYDYYYSFISDFYGAYDVDFYANGDGTFSANVPNYVDYEEDFVTLYDVVLREKGTAVKDIENTVAKGEKMYFDLQGRRIARPANGLYIEKVNGKTVKRMAK